MSVDYMITFFCDISFFQTLNMQPANSSKNLTFVPLAPACVVSKAMLVMVHIFQSHP